MESKDLRIADRRGAGTPNWDRRKKRRGRFTVSKAEVRSI